MSRNKRPPPDSLENERNNSENHSNSWFNLSRCWTYIKEKLPWYRSENDYASLSTFVQLGTSLAEIVQRCHRKEPSVIQLVIEGYITYIEDVRTSKTIIVDESDTVHAWKSLLQSDFSQLFEYFKVEENETMMDHLREIENWDIPRLTLLCGKIHILRTIEEQEENDLKKFSEDHMKRMNDFNIFLEDLNKLGSTISSHISKTAFPDDRLQFILRKLEEHQKICHKHEKAEYVVDNITKRSLGKMIVHHVGNEGVDSKPDLRQLLQACIDHLRTEPAYIWKNASFTIFDDSGIFKIKSGSKRNGFICEMKNGVAVVQKEGCAPEKGEYVFK